jgi:hypothetical protein
VNRRVVVSHLSRGNALFPFTRQAQALPAELGHSPVKSWPDAKGCNHLSVQVTQAALMQGGFIEPVMLRSEFDEVGGPGYRGFVRPIGNRPEWAWHFYLRSCKSIS